MVKYGKEFRQAQNPSWKSKYFDYKKLKKQIKLYISPENQEPDLIINKDINNSSSYKPKSKSEMIKDFISLLNSEIRTIYLFYTREEKALHRDINKSLFSKDNYPLLDQNEFINEFNTLNETSSNVVNLAKYLFYNLKALIKIIKKFDKKCLPNNTRHHLKIKYIQHKLEEQNSDLLDMYKFKVIDEVCAIIEDLVTTLQCCYKEKASSFKSNHDNVLVNSFDNKNKILDNNNFSASIITKEIINKVKEVDKINLQIKTLFEPWNDFLKISSLLTRKLYSLTKQIDEKTKDEHNKLDSHFNSSDVNVDNFNKLNVSSISNNLPHIFKKEHSIMGNILISHPNKVNVQIILFQTYLYFFSYSIQIPFHIKYLDTLHYPSYYIGLLAAMMPIGAILSFSLSSTWSLYSTKKPLVFSMLLLLIGNLLCCLSKYFDMIYLLLIGRFIIGLGCNRIGNKMYLMNFIPKQYLNKYIIKFYSCTLLGLSIGFIINIPLIKICTNMTNAYITIENVGAFICCVLCCFGFVIALCYLKEGFDADFYITTSYLDGKQINIMRNEENKDNDELNPQLHNMTVDESIRKDTFMIEDLDEQLNQANEINQFTETNLVPKSVNKITKHEKTQLSFLKRNFIIFALIVFTSKVINEFMLINSPLYFHAHYNSYNNMSYLSLMLGMSYIFVLLIENSVYLIKNCLSDRKSLLILISLIFIVSFLLIVQFYDEKNIWEYFIGMIWLIILSNLLEKTASSFFSKIIPNDFQVFDIKGNTIINIVSNIGRILGAMIPILSEKYDLIQMNKGTFIYFISLSVVTFTFMILYYDDLRIKAISRILFDNEKGHHLQIPNEI